MEIVYSGHVRVYQWNGTDTWTQLGSDIDGEASRDESGASVSLSSDGTIVAIGAWGNDGNGSGAGHVRVFQWNGTDTWTQLGSDIDGEAAGDNSGSSVSLSNDGTILAIGAFFNDGNGQYSGHVRVYQWNGTDTWTQIGTDIDGEAAYDYSGNTNSVSLSGDGFTLAISANNNDGNGDNSGHVRVYKVAESRESNVETILLTGDGGDISIDGTLSADTISEKTSAAGVTIDSVLLKDNTVTAHTVTASNYAVGGTNFISASRQGNFRDLEVKNSGNTATILLTGDGGTITANSFIGDGSQLTGLPEPDLTPYAPLENPTFIRNIEVIGLETILPLDVALQLGEDIDGEAAGDAAQCVSLSDDGTIVAIGALIMMETVQIVVM